MNCEGKKKYINIGLVGHVSNGKTTLVKALTGVNTKKDSSEIKSGRTIKLGYANCLLWKCENCLKIYSTSQSEKKIKCCENDLITSFYTSLVDSPGHHSYVHTMIKGAAVIDCAIIVSDVQAKTLQPQTLEHLVILESLGVRNVIVLQNKIDLVSFEQCKENYEMLKKELVGTIAEGAPIIPISAQTNLGIEKAREYIFKMVSIAIENLDKYNENLFTIIRSFDINKPNTPESEKKGGVIGGTMIGEEGFLIGDKIEIRPGILENGLYIPVETTILSIFSERDNCEGMGRGGLYGLGTDLDGKLTQADGLVGNLAGKKDNLPENKWELNIEVFKMKNYIDGLKTEKIKIGSEYQLIIGSIISNSVVFSKQKEENKYTFKLSKPICTINTRCIIYNKESKLIGYGIFNKENKEKINKNLNIQQTELDYLKMLGNREEKKTDKTKIPIPSLAKENKNIIWTNINTFCQTIKRNEIQVSTYIKEELYLQTSICQNGLRMSKANINSTKLQSVLKKYIVENVSCLQCKSLDTIMRKNQARGTEIHCLNCGSDTSCNSGK